MSTKLNGDLAEQAAILQGLKHGFGILKPQGDRLPYDVVFDVDGQFIKIQVKSAWLHRTSGNEVVDNRRTQTNRRLMKRSPYRPQDFDFALAYLADKDLFYIFPSEVFVKYGSEIHMVESPKRQRKPQSAIYRDAWHLILQWAAAAKAAR